MRMPAREGSAPGNSGDERLKLLLQKWVEGKIHLKDVRGYKDEELYAIAKTAYYFYYQGRINEARTLFQGLYSVNPTDPYFAKALGVVELAAGNPQGALAAYEVALKLSPKDASAYAGRAEVRSALGQRPQALEDWRKAAQCADPDDPIRVKAEAILIAASHPPARKR